MDASSRRTLARILLGFPVVVAGCTDIGSEPVPDQRDPAELEMTVARDLISEGEETEATVRLWDRGGRPFERLPPWFRLESSDEEILTVHDGVRLRGEGAGTAILRARSQAAEAEREVRVNPARLDLTVESVIVNQSAQDLDGSIPLVAGRRGFLRVFLRGDEVNFFEPQVRVRLYHEGQLQETLTLEPTQEGVPEAVDEDALEGSWGAPIPAELIAPGLELVVEADPQGLVPLTDEGTSVRYPRDGRSRLDVRELPDLKMTLIPIQQPDGEGGTIPSSLGQGNRDAFLSPFLRMFPVAEEPDIQLREPFRVSRRAVDGPSWVDVLQELRALQLSEAPDRYHYGVLRVTAGNIRGIAYVGLPTGLGLDDISSGGHHTLAHELGHTMGLWHAPCRPGSGLPANVDDDFPQDDGSIGSAGIDAFTGTLHRSDRPDIMGYCRPAWIGPHMYGNALSFREREEPLGEAGSAGTGAEDAGQARGNVLVFGSVHGGEVRLSPALQVNAPPVLPEESRTGDHLLEGFDEKGRPLFQLPFRPLPIADAHPDVGGFAFVLPAGMARPQDLSELRVTGPGGMDRRAATVSPSERSSPEVAAEPRIARHTEPDASVPADLEVVAEEDGVRIRWNPHERPLIAVRDADGRRTLAFGRGGEVTVPGHHREVVVDLSHGTGSEAFRVEVGEPR